MGVGVTFTAQSHGCMKRGGDSSRLRQVNLNRTKSLMQGVCFFASFSGMGSKKKKTPDGVLFLPGISESGMAARRWAMTGALGA